MPTLIDLNALADLKKRIARSTYLSTRERKQILQVVKTAVDLMNAIDDLSSCRPKKQDTIKAALERARRNARPIPGI